MKTPQLPVPKLAAALGLKNEIWLKREDQHKYGSHKGRSIPLMIEEYHRAGWNNFVISSSGNAALAALLFIQANNRNKPQEQLTLTILVGHKIDPAKLKRLQDTIHNTHITIQQVANPKQAAFQADQANQAKNLRQSTDDLALVGYEELAAELARIPELTAVFIPTSSGTTAQGLRAGFQKLGLNPQIHIVQTETCHPMVTVIATRPGRGSNPLASRTTHLLNQGDRHGHDSAKAESGLAMTEPSLATAIVDKIARRLPQVQAALKTSHGAGWVASNKDIKEAQQIIKQTTSLVISPNSALAIVGLQQAVAAGWTWKGAVVCLLTGN